MAQQFQVQYIDDLDGTDLGSVAHTISFAFDGKEYSIDLSDENAAQFREVMAPYVENGRRVTGTKAKTARKSTGRPEKPRLSVTGPGITATRSPTAAGFPPTSWMRTPLRTRLFELGSRIRFPARAGIQPRRRVSLNEK